MRRELYGYLLVILAAALWAVGGVVAKFLFNNAISPFLLVKLRMTLSCLIMVVILAICNHKLLYIKRKDIKGLIILGIAGLASMQLTYFLTISLTNVATAVFLQYMSPVMMAIHAVLWEKVVLGIRSIAAIVLAMVGGFLIMVDVSGWQGFNQLGIVTGILSAVTMAFNTIHTRNLIRTYYPATVLTYSLGVGAVFFWLLMPYTWEPGSITREHWLMFLYVAVFSTVIPFGAFYMGLQFVSPTNAGITACLEPVMAAVVAYVALGETMGWLQVVGGALVVAAVILLQLKSPAAKAVEQPVASETVK